MIVSALRNLLTYLCCVFAVSVALSANAFEPLPAPENRPHLLVLTDIGGDPDDTQSLVRLLLYANHFEFKGFVASAAGTPGELKEKVTKPELIRELIMAYGKVQPNLAMHAASYPTAAELLTKVKSGNPNRGLAAIGEDHDTEGSKWIIQCFDEATPDKPLHIAIWGGQTDLAQALWRVKNDRSPKELVAIQETLRIYDIADQDGIQSWIHKEFPDLFYILNKAPRGKNKLESVFRGMYLGGDISTTSREWIDTNVRNGHGPLGALYPAKTWTAPNPHSTMKEGDTPSWFYFLANGLGESENPTWGGWGGRFQSEDGKLFVDAEDTIEKTTEARASVWRWRPAFQNEFQARLDWCVKKPADANHPPKVSLLGDAGLAVKTIRLTTGETVKLNASAADPDGDDVTYRWWIYPEVSSLSDVTIQDANTSSPEVILPTAKEPREPADAKAAVHVILEVTDKGSPPLTSYRRVILEVTED